MKAQMQHIKKKYVHQLENLLTISTCTSPLQEIFIEYDLILGPCNEKNIHWTMLVSS